MKAKIHPKYDMIKATCSCGNVINVPSTLDHDLNLDICSKCHPFYTGKQKNIDAGGRIDKFTKKFGNRGKAKAANEAETKSDDKAE